VPSGPTSTASREADLLDAARRGDEGAFRAIVDDHRRELHVHCYRMLGSVQDAEDVLQETLLRAWRGLPKFQSRSSPRTWLYTIATNACLDLIAKRPKRILPVEYGPASEPRIDQDEPPLVESVWIEPYPDDELGLPDGHAAPDARYEQREAVELAFIAALQHLPATQRAVLVMRDVLGFSAREAAESLDTSVASVNSALQRAHKTVEERLPERSQQATIRSLGDDRMRALVAAYVEAWERGDTAAVAALLAEDAVFSMPPWSMWWRGRDAIAGFAATAVETCAESVTFPVQANGQLAMAYYSLDADRGTCAASAIDVFTFEDALIKEITAFVTPGIFPSFGLPPALDAGRA
jgi:RNA polymerase sigma-70 factor, ECF subfamily